MNEAHSKEKEYIKELILCIHEKDANQLENLFYEKPITNQEYIDYLNLILTQSWHNSHETIASYLQQIKSPASITALLEAAQMKFKYLEYDNSEALARKCIWALADIGTDKSKAALENLSGFNESTIAGYAKKRIDNWESELNRKAGNNNHTIPDYYFLDRYKNKPWLVWLIICLCRQRHRQEWLGEIHQKISKLDLPRHGQVPDMQDWSYHYHGIGLCLNGPNQEVLDVDFHDNDVKTIDPYFLTNRITRLNPVPKPEQRLLRWLPNESLINAGIKYLQGESLSSAESHVFKLSQHLEEIWEEIAEMNFSEDNIYESWLNQLEATKTGKENQEIVNAHINWLEELLSLKNQSNSLFGGVLNALPGDKQLALCEKYLKKPISHSTAQIVEVLHYRKNSPVQGVVELLDRLKPKKHHPYIAWQICRFLLKLGIDKEHCIKTLNAFSDQRIVKGYGGNPYDYELAVLCLAYAPKRGFKLLRRALRSATPYAIQQTAALMAAIDEPWCHYELEMAINDYLQVKEPTNRRVLATAMINSSNIDVKEKGKQLIPPSRVRTETDIGYTYDEVVEANLDEGFAANVKKASQDVLKLNLKTINEAWVPIEEKKSEKMVGLFSKFLRKIISKN